MKKCILIFALSLLCCLPVRAAAGAAPAVSAGSMILCHGDSGHILAEKNADTPLPMASTTKIMTALLTIENCALTERVTITDECTRVEGSSMYLRAGETYTVEELLYGLMLNSGNDAALALAAYTAGSVTAFVEQMNIRAAELGMDHTAFQNPHGLPAEGHYSTAGDMALLMAEAMKNESFRTVAATRYYTGHGTYRNHNKLLWLWEGITGGKTGYTRSAGRCLVSACEREGLELICVTLSAPNDWNDHMSLYNWGFDAYCAYKLDSGAVAARIPVITGARQDVAAVPEKGVCLCVPRGSSMQLRASLPGFVYAPVYAGGRAGTVEILCDGDCIASDTLLWAEDVELQISDE